MLDSLRDNAYGMYLIHYAFVSWLQYALLKVALPAFVKGSLAFSATLALSGAQLQRCDGFPLWRG